ncbi:hypothetical protein [Paenibacillus whitsoniae]|nr:hypothetical protein [Paenibacillus whitsoniae]
MATAKEMNWRASSSWRGGAAAGGPGSARVDDELEILQFIFAFSAESGV